MEISEYLHIEHRKRLRKIQADALVAIAGTCTSLLSIYWTVSHGLPFKAYFLDGVARTIVVLTALMYIFVQYLALSTCLLSWRLSALRLKKDLNQHFLSRQNNEPLQE
jgi:hypothetical protein